jgi:hypothetical protein
LTFSTDLWIVATTITIAIATRHPTPDTESLSNEDSVKKET